MLFDDGQISGTFDGSQWDYKTLQEKVNTLFGRSVLLLLLIQASSKCIIMYYSPSTCIHTSILSVIQRQMFFFPFHTNRLYTLCTVFCVCMVDDDGKFMRRTQTCINTKHAQHHKRASFTSIHAVQKCLCVIEKRQTRIHSTRNGHLFCVHIFNLVF